ncbi:MAG: mannitol dehydrogenase family protein [Chloroflexota bacterium]
MTDPGRRLHPDALGALPAGIGRPRFDRGSLRGGIVHLGLGAFARAHLLACTDDALEAGAGPAWGVIGVSLRHPDVRDALGPQGGLYALTLRDAERTVTRVIGSVREVLVAPEDPGAVIERIAHPDTRIVSLTVTEKGYCHDPATRRLRPDHPDIAHDLADPAAPASAIGFIVRGLARRRAAGRGPVTLLSLDNLPANGQTLRGLVLAFAERVDGDLARWIAAVCTFPDSMVDRIVPRTTDADRAEVARALGVADAGAIVAEPYLAWAVEDRFVAGRPDWSAGGARFVERAEPWEHLKLRMLNGPHSTIAYLGVLAGWPTVDAAVAQPALRRYIDALMRAEIAPTVAGSLPGVDLDAYRADLLARFANPALAHRTAQIAMDGSQKLPQRLLGTVRDRLAAGAPIDRLALAIAAWCRYLGGTDEAGRTHAVDDPLAAELATLHARAVGEPTIEARAAAFTRFAPVFGDLADAPALVAPLARGLAALRDDGVAGALARLAG